MQISGSNLKASCCGAGPRFTMDTPHRSGAVGQIPMTRLLGHAINSRGLATMKPGDNSVAMIRANNLGSLTAAMLLHIKPERREWALTEVGGLNFTNSVLKFAEANTALPSTDAIRFSCALHFLLGIVDMEAGKNTMMAEGYRKFARFFKDAQDRRAGRAEGTTAARDGLHGLQGLGVPASLVQRSIRTQHLEDNSSTKKVAPSTTAQTNAEASGYIPPQPSKVINWDTVGMNDTPTPSALLTNIQSRDSSGRCIRWSPTDPCYPAPEDRNGIDWAPVQADACGRTADQLVPTLQQKKQAKVDGIRRTFSVVFGRAPNNSELQYYANMQWCASDFGGQPPTRWGDPMVAITTRMIWVREDIERGTCVNTTPPVGQGRINESDFTIRTALTDIAGSLKYAADAAFDFLGKVAEGIADILCKGFKALFGPAVGGVICTIITFLMRMMVGGIAAIINIVIESISGVVEFITELSKGGEKAIENAFVALLRSMGRILFSLASPMMVPVLMMDTTKNLSMSQAMAKMKERADRVTAREPLWPLMVIMAVVGVFSAVSGNVLGAITGLITALAPMVATFISEPMKENIDILKTETLEDIEAGIAKFIKFVLLIFNGAMSIKGLVTQLRGQLAKYVGAKGAGGLTGDVTNKDGTVTKASPAQRIKYVMEKLSAGFAVITKAFQNFNVKDIVKSAGPILMLIPDLLLAILPNDAAEALPTLTDWRAAVVQSEKNVAKQEQILRDGAVDIFNSFTLGTQKDFLRAQTTRWKKDAAGNDTNVPLLSPQDAAAIVAAPFAQQFKNRATYPAFINAFRIELLKA